MLAAPPLRAEWREAVKARLRLGGPTAMLARLWSALKACQLGVSFRRQVLIGGFIADFCAPSIRLVVEVDGGYHHRKPLADESRERKLRRLGYRVVRVRAELVMRDLAAAVASVRAAL